MAEGAFLFEQAKGLHPIRVMQLTRRCSWCYFAGGIWKAKREEIQPVPTYILPFKNMTDILSLKTACYKVRVTMIITFRRVIIRQAAGRILR
jgi:hypothetical protein